MATAPPSIGVTSLPIPATLPQPGPTPGEVLAPALEDVGNAAGQVALLRKDQRQAAEASSATVAWLKDLPDIRAQADAMRQSSDFDASTYGDQVRALVSDRIVQHLDQVADPVVRQRLATVFNEWGSSEIVRARLAGVDAAATQLVTNHVESRDHLGSNLIAHPEDLSTALVTLGALRDSYKTMPPDQKAKLAREDDDLLNHMAAYGKLGQDPQGGLSLINNGYYQLKPEDQITLTRYGEVLVRRQEVEARQAVTQQRQDAVTFIHNIQQRVDNHIPVPPSDFETAQALMGRPELRLQGEGFDLGKAQTVDGVSRTYQNATPQTISNDLNTLNADIAKKGDKVDPTEVIRRNALESMLGQRRQEMNSDPMGLFARAGGQVQPLNPLDPASIAARKGAWQKALLQLGPNVGPLGQDEASQYEQQLAKGGAAGRIEVVDTLANFGGDMGVAAARQIAGGNQHLQTAVALAAMGPAGRAAARDSLLGSDAIAAHRGIVNEAAAQQVFGRFSQALTGLTPDAAHGIYDTAMGIYATRQARAGQVDPWPKTGDSGQRTAFMAALQTALGASKRANGEVAGGAGSHNGGWTLLPTTMTQREFETAFSHAGPKDFERAAGGATPVYANGYAPRIDQFKAMRLEAVGDGRYRVKLGNAYLGVKGQPGQIYEFDATKLPVR